MRARVLCAILAVVLVFSAAAPAFAAPNEKALAEAAAAAVKKKLSIDESYTEFNYSVSQGRGIVYSFTWSKSGESGDSSISVESDEKGSVLRYYTYDSGDYYNNYRASLKELPKITKEKALALADNFLKTAVPEMQPNLTLKSMNCNRTIDLEYDVSYNGISAPGVSASLSVDPVAMKVTSYYQWGSELSDMPDPAKKISQEAAEKAIKELGGLELVYTRGYGKDDAPPEVLLAYRINPVRIDALTGKEYVPVMLPLGEEAGSGETDTGYYAADSEASNEKSAPQEYRLTDGEKAEIDKMANVISDKEAESIVRKLPFGKLTDDYVVTYKYLNSDPYGAYFGQGKYQWNLNFESKSGRGSCSATLDAETGRVNKYSFYDYSQAYKGPDSNRSVTNEQLAEARAAAEAAIKSYMPDYFGKTAWQDIRAENMAYYWNGIEMNFARVENSLPFPDDGFRVTYNPDSKTITDYGFSWTEGASFPDPAKAAAFDDAFAGILKKNPISMQYDVGYDQKPGLVYTFKNGYGYYDAVTFEPQFEDYGYIGYGSPAVDPLKGYDDIAGHFAQSKIEALSMLKIGFESDSFEPYRALSQRDFLYLLRQCFEDGYYPMLGKDAGSGAYDEDVYRYMTERGIVKEDEKAPESVITRETAAVFISRTLGYGALTSKQGLFTQDFSDMAASSTEAKNAVAVIKALGIASGSGGAFMPKKQLSRGEAAAMLYNMLAAAKQ